MTKKQIEKNVVNARAILGKDGRLPAKYVEAALANIENHSYRLAGEESFDVIDSFRWGETPEYIFSVDFWGDVYGFLQGESEPLPPMPRIPDKARIIRVFPDYSFYLYSNGDILQGGERIKGLKTVIRKIEAAWDNKVDYSVLALGDWRVQVYKDCVKFGCQQLMQKEAKKVFSELKSLIKK